MDPVKQTSRWRTVFEIGSTVLMIGLAAVFVIQGRVPGAGGPAPGRTATRMPLPSEPIAINGSATRGSETAKAVLIVFSDFECPFCAKFATEIDPVLREEYVDRGRLQVVFKHFPLTIHKNAHAAARTAWCAGRQNRFWEMHDRLFGMTTRLGTMNSETLATELGLDVPSFTRCVAGSESDQAVVADKSQGEKLLVSATPLFFFGSRLPAGRVSVTHIISGVRTIEEFRKALEPLL